MRTRYRTGDFHLHNTQPSYAPSLPLEPVHGTLRFNPDVLNHRLQVSIEWTLVSRVDSANELILNGIDLDIVRVQSPNNEISIN